MFGGVFRFGCRFFLSWRGVGGGLWGGGVGNWERFLFGLGVVLIMVSVGWVIGGFGGGIFGGLVGRFFEGGRLILNGMVLSFLLVCFLCVWFLVWLIFLWLYCLRVCFCGFGIVWVGLRIFFIVDVGVVMWLVGGVMG